MWVKKTAERLVIEMRDKLKSWESDMIVNTKPQLAGLGSGKISIHSAMSEVQSALISLGYKPTDASRVVSRLAEDHDFSSISSAELLRLALKGKAI